MFRRSLLLLPVLLFLSASAQNAEFSIGFDGEVVAGRWNPFEFSFRDFSDVTLTLTIDQGDLRSGSIPAVSTFHMAGGAGLSVIENELFVPPWQSFTWSASTSQRVIASGSFHPRDLDTRPLAVILSTAAGRHAALVPEGSRFVGLPSARLPERLAAWDGVSLLVIDGSTAPPSLEAVVAATAAGATVLLLEPLPASFAELLLLAEAPRTRLGAGQLVRGDELPEGLQTFDTGALEQHLADRVQADPARPMRLIFLAPVLIAGSILTVLLVRLAGFPGLVGATGLGILIVVLAWPALRPEPTVTSAELSLRVSAGGLSRSLSAVRTLDRTGGEISLPGSWRPFGPYSYERTDERSLFPAERWRTVDLFGRPQLAPAGPAPAVPAQQDDILLLFPAGSSVTVTGSLIEVFLPGADQ